MHLAVNMFVAIATVGMSIMASMSDAGGMIELVKQFGPLLFLIGFFIWRDWQREKELGKLLKIERDFNRDTLQKMVERSNKNAEACSKRARRDSQSSMPTVQED